MNSKTFLIIFSKHAPSLWRLRVFMALFLLVSCKSKQPFSIENMDANISENCPENGRCSLEVFQNKTLNILKDDFGKTYPEIGEGSQLVLKFKFERNVDLMVVDGHYIEEVFIQMDPNDLEKNTTQLKHEKLLFARLCFCRGQTGYYRIRTGNISIKNIKDKTYQIDFDFKIEDVPQVITSISEIFSLK